MNKIINMIFGDNDDHADLNVDDNDVDYHVNEKHDTDYDGDYDVGDHDDNDTDEYDVND